VKTGAPTPAELKRALFGQPKRTNPETPIVTSCLQYLNLLPGVTVWRQNVGGRDYVTAEGKTGYVAFGQAGMADISGIAGDGRRIEIEVKQPGEEPRPDQYAWLRMVVEHGGVGFWCDSLDSCMRQAKEWGLEAR
jgi:hypothetical protein